jgi:hypothetical protein
MRVISAILELNNGEIHLNCVLKATTATQELFYQQDVHLLFIMEALVLPMFHIVVRVLKVTSVFQTILWSECVLWVITAPTPHLSQYLVLLAFTTLIYVLGIPAHALVVLLALTVMYQV